MERMLFSLLMLLAFLISFESLTSDSKELSLADEIMWLFNEDSILEKMDSSHTNELVRNLERARNDLTRASHDKAMEKQASADLVNLNPALTKAKELERALDRLAEVKRNYQGQNPNLSKQTFDYVDRTKRELLELLREFYRDDRQLEKLFK